MKSYKEIVENAYKELQKYFDPQSEYGIDYVDCIFDLANVLGVKCTKVDEGELSFD